MFYCLFTHSLIYMLHGTVIIVAFGPLVAWLGTEGIAFNVALYAVAFGGTMALATATTTPTTASRSRIRWGT